MEAPSGKGRELPLWGDGHRNPELEAVEAVIHIALDGQLGTIKRCYECAQWFLTKNDFRVCWCPEHDVDELRKGTAKRIEQVKAAAKRARDRERDEEEKYWQEERKRQDERHRPSAHRAEK